MWEGELERVGKAGKRSCCRKNPGLEWVFIPSGSATLSLPDLSHATAHNGATAIKGQDWPRLFWILPLDPALFPINTSMEKRFWGV